MFKEGDLVYHPEYLSGLVTFVDTNEYPYSVIPQMIVKFDNGVSRNCTVTGIFALELLPILQAI